MKRMRGAFVAVAMILAPPAQAREAVRYLLPAPITLPAFAPWLLAKQLGYYADAGYDVDFMQAQGGVDVAKQIGAGNADIGGAIGDTPIVVRANGVPVKAIAVLGGGSLTVIAARADRGIATIGDLKGKIVSVLSYQDTTYYALLGSLATAGLGKSDVNIQAVGAAGVTSLVLSGTVDACACTPDSEVIVRQGLPNAIVIPTGNIFPSMAQAILTSDDAIKRKPDMLRAVVGATLRGMQFIMRDPKAAADSYATANPGYAGKQDLLVQIFEQYAALTYGGQPQPGAIDAARLAALQDFYLKQSIIRKATKVDDLYSTAFLPAKAAP